MKRTFTVALLAFACIAPSLQAQPARIDYSQKDTGWRDRDGNPSRETGYDGVSRRDARAANERNARQDARQNARHDDRRDARQDQRQANLRQERAQLNRDRRNWRDQRRYAQWDQQLHNGYYRSNGQWRYGQPSNWQTQQRGFALGYRPWTQGQSLGAWNSRFVAIDHRSRNLRAPPRGYRWVEDDRGDYLLAAIVGGLIAQVIINSPR